MICRYFVPEQQEDDRSKLVLREIKSAKNSLYLRPKCRHIIAQAVRPGDGPHLFMSPIRAT
jgi:hypothetical protein